MSNSYQNELPKAPINLHLGLHTGGAAKKAELPLKLLVTGDFSNGAEDRPLSECDKINVNKNNVKNNQAMSDATANSRINARLPYIFLLSRIAHSLVEGMDVKLSLVSQIPKAKA